jgi:cell division protein FtsB
MLSPLGYFDGTLLDEMILNQADEENDENDEADDDDDDEAEKIKNLKKKKDCVEIDCRDCHNFFCVYSGNYIII